MPLSLTPLNHQQPGPAAGRNQVGQRDRAQCSETALPGNNIEPRGQRKPVTLFPLHWTCSQQCTEPVAGRNWMRRSDWVQCSKPPHMRSQKQTHNQPSVSLINSTSEGSTFSYHGWFPVQGTGIQSWNIIDSLMPEPPHHKKIPGKVADQIPTPGSFTCSNPLYRSQRQHSGSQADSIFHSSSWRVHFMYVDAPWFGA